MLGKSAQDRDRGVSRVDRSDRILIIGQVHRKTIIQAKSQPIRCAHTYTGVTDEKLVREIITERRRLGGIISVLKASAQIKGQALIKHILNILKINLMRGKIITDRSVSKITPVPGAQRITQVQSPKRIGQGKRT